MWIFAVAVFNNVTICFDCDIKTAFARHLIAKTQHLTSVTTAKFVDCQVDLKGRVVIKEYGHIIEN
ncbi:MAG: hypothetical protein AAFY88_15830, partial [Acidobacteriota bacterium]